MIFRRFPKINKDCEDWRKIRTCFGLLRVKHGISEVIDVDGRVLFDPKFQFEFSKFSFVEWKGIFHRAGPISFHSRLGTFLSKNYSTNNNNNNFIVTRIFEILQRYINIALNTLLLKIIKLKKLDYNNSVNPQVAWANLGVPHLLKN